MTAPIRPRSRQLCILCPGDTARAGGIGQFVANLTAELPRVEPDLRFEVVDTRGSRHIALAPLYFLRALARIAGLALRGQLGLLHVNLSSHGSTVRKLTTTGLAFLLRAPMIVHLHGSRFDRFYRSLPRPLRALVRGMFAYSSHVVVLGEFWRRFVVDELRVAPEKVEVIGNGVFAPSVSIPAPSGPVHLVFIGRLGDRKGVPELLAALAQPELAQLDWRATIAGDGEVARFVQAAQVAGIGQRVDFPGWVDRAAVDRLLAGATVFVLPSHAEGLPLSVLEAMAYGVPVIATPVGALPEFLADGVSALLVPPGDPNALACALVRLVSDPSLRARLGEAGQAVFHAQFDIGTVARRFALVYRCFGCELLTAGDGSRSYE